MGNFQGKFESAKQDWTTPDPLYNHLDNIYKFTIDLAASEENTKCNRYYSEEDDSMSKNWSDEVGWLNPPYGAKGQYKLSQWIIKAYKEKSTTVMLIPARTNTRWWKEYCMKAKEILFIIGRPKFGDAKHGLPQPLAIIVFSDTDEETKYGYIDLKDIE